MVGWAVDIEESNSSQRAVFSQQPGVKMRKVSAPCHVVLADALPLQQHQKSTSEQKSPDSSQAFHPESASWTVYDKGNLDFLSSYGL
jgi:hypothetical protein